MVRSDHIDGTDKMIGGREDPRNVGAPSRVYRWADFSSLAQVRRYPVIIVIMMTRGSVISGDARIA